MALTQNEQLIIKYVGQNFLTKETMGNIIPCQTLAGQTEYSNTWLTKDGENPLIPIEGAFYMVTNLGKIYKWNRSEYEQANLPSVITAEEITEMWQ